MKNSTKLVWSPCPRNPGLSPLRKQAGILILGILILGVAGIGGCKGGKSGGSNQSTGPDPFNVTVNLAAQGAGNGNGHHDDQTGCEGDLL